MTEITLEGIAAVIKEELKPINEKLEEQTELLKRHTEILEIHTGSLEKLVTKKKTGEDNEVVSAHRIDRLENWGKLAGKKVGVNLEL